MFGFFLEGKLFFLLTQLAIFLIDKVDLCLYKLNLPLLRLNRNRMVVFLPAPSHIALSVFQSNNI